MFELRVVGPDDWRLWREVRLAALAEAPYAFGARLADWQGEGDREERWRARLEVAGSHNVVVTVDGRSVGMVSGVPTERTDAVELISMWVSPAVRGQGVGDRLIDEVVRWAVRAGAAVLRLSVFDGNVPALALYERHGFRDSGEAGDLLADAARRKLVLAKALGTVV